MTDRELLQHAMKQLKYGFVNSEVVKAIEERLAQPEQEPVAWVFVFDDGEVSDEFFFPTKSAGERCLGTNDWKWDGYIAPLYTAPQPAAQPVLCKSEVKRLAIQMGLFGEQLVPDDRERKLLKQAIPMLSSDGDMSHWSDAHSQAVINAIKAAHGIGGQHA